MEAAGDAFARRVLVPLAPGAPRLHHHVPQFLLRRFANERGRIATIPLDDPARPRIASVGNTAAIRDFYSTIADGVGPNVAVERLLAEIDGRASAVVDKLTSKSPLPVTGTERESLALFLAFQNVRGPRFRREAEALTDLAIKAQLTMDENREAHGGKLEEEFTRYDDVEFAEHQNEAIRLMLDLVEPLAGSLRTRLITIVRFGQPGAVLTDDPMVLYRRPGPQSGIEGVGVATADEVWLPLDRSTGLILHHDTAVGERVLDFQGKPAVMLDFNQRVVSSCFSEIYAHPDDVPGVLSLVLPDLDRPLIRVEGSTDWVRGRTDGVNDVAERRRPRRFDRDAEPTSDQASGP
jgi:hypothetical protein